MCRVDGIVPLRVENIVAVLREPGKCEALEPDNIELARQTPEQLELWSRIAANWQLTPSWCGGFNHFRLTLVATARSAPWRRVLDTRKVRYEAPCSHKAVKFTPKILCFNFILRGGYWCFLKETT